MRGPRGERGGLKVTFHENKSQGSADKRTLRINVTHERDRVEGKVKGRIITDPEGLELRSQATSNLPTPAKDSH